MKWSNWLVIIGFVILFGWCVIVNNQYLSLQKDFDSLKNNKEHIIDSLNNENIKTKHTIKVLKDSLKTVEVNIINQSNKIIEIKKEEFVISTSLSKSAELLKKNILCTKL